MKTLERLLFLVACVSLGLLMGTVASGQTVTNPTRVEFVASADHATLFDTIPILTRYELRIFLNGATQPFTTTDLGKPTPGAGNLISVTNPAWFTALAMNSLYLARVAAIGPAGEGVSDASNFFGRVGPPVKPGVPVVRQ